MTNENSRERLQVGKVVRLETLGNFLYESSGDGVCRFVGREGEEIVRYSVPTGSVIPGRECYVASNYSKDVLRPGSPRFTQVVDVLRRAKI